MWQNSKECFTLTTEDQMETLNCWAIQFNWTVHWHHTQPRSVTLFPILDSLKTKQVQFVRDHFFLVSFLKIWSLRKFEKPINRKPTHTNGSELNSSLTILRAYWISVWSFVSGIEIFYPLFLRPIPLTTPFLKIYLTSWTTFAIFLIVRSTFKS